MFFFLSWSSLSLSSSQINKKVKSFFLCLFLSLVFAPTSSASSAERRHEPGPHRGLHRRRREGSDQDPLPGGERAAPHHLEREREFPFRRGQGLERVRGADPAREAEGRDDARAEQWDKR